jgi:hypothetical protein
MVAGVESLDRIDYPPLVLLVVTAVMAVDQRELAVVVKLHLLVEPVAYCCGFLLVLGHSQESALTILLLTGGEIG